MKPGTRTGVRARIAEFAEDPVKGVESLIIEDQPYPASLTPQDVVIAVKSSAVGWVDLIMTSGQYQHMPPLPYTPGLEYSGCCRLGWRSSQENLRRRPRRRRPL